MHDVPNGAWMGAMVTRAQSSEKRNGRSASGRHTRREAGARRAAVETTVRQAAHKTQARLIVARRESSPMFFSTEMPILPMSSRTPHTLHEERSVSPPVTCKDPPRGCEEE